MFGFGGKSRAERLRDRIENIRGQAEDTSFDLIGSLTDLYEEVRPVVERLLYDDDLRDNIRTFIESGRNIIEELSDESPAEAVAKLWDDDKLRRQVEMAVGAAEEGSRRVRGQKIKSGGGRSSRFVFLLLATAVGFLFLNPKTGPEARRFAREAYSALTSEG